MKEEEEEGIKLLRRNKSSNSIANKTKRKLIAVWLCTENFNYKWHIMLIGS